MIFVAALPVCAQSKSADRPLPPPPSLPLVTMSEYHVDMPAELPPGRAVFRVNNAGQIDHQLTVLRLPDDYPATFEEQFRSPNRYGLEPLVLLPIQSPGTTQTFALDLAPGRYGLLCFLVDADSGIHAVKGEAAIVVVR